MNKVLADCPDCFVVLSPPARRAADCGVLRR